MRIRKLMALLFAVVLVAGILPTHIFAASTTDIVISSHTAGNLSTELSTVYANGCSRDQVTSITVSSGEITADDWSALLSALIDSNHITTINLSGTTTSAPVPDDMFSNQMILTSVTLPSGSYSIKDRVFSSCTGLTSITIPGTVTSIGKYAFSGCKSLISISIPESATSIGEGAFNGCENLSSITGNIVSFGKEIFCGCTHLTSITIPDTVTSIGDSAFKNCAGLSAVTIPQSVTSIGNEAFYGCTHLYPVTFSGTPSVTHIGYSAFEGDTSLTAITIPASVTTIDFKAFYNCTNLSSVTMNSNTPINAGNIGNAAFDGTADNVVLYVPNGSENVWDASDGTKDHRMRIGVKQFKIENLPPMLHYHIGRVSDTEAIIDISSDEDGFYYYEIVKASDIAPTINTSGAGTSLDAGPIDVTKLSTGPYKLYVIAKDSLGNIMGTPEVVNIEAYFQPVDITISHTAGNFASELNSAMTTYIHYSNIKNLTVSGGVFNDADWQALAAARNPDDNDNSNYMYNALTVNFSGVSSTSSVPDYTFSGFYSLQSVVLPSGVTGLGRSAFEDCASLTSITIPSSVASIGRGAFGGCSSLASITSLAATPPTLQGSGVFSRLPSTGTLTVPSGSVAAYTSAWGSYLPGHWTIQSAGSPAPYSGGASSGNSTYNANVSGSGSQTTLPVTVDAGSKTASVDLGTQSFSQAGAVITVPSIPDTHTYSAKIPVSDLSTSASKGTLTVKTGNGSITVPSNMLTSDTSGSKANISIGQADKTTLPANVQTAIGDHPLIQLSMTIDGKQTEWSNPNAPVTVSIPYKPTADELQDPESIVIWYIDGSGKAVSIPNGHYDAATGTVIFMTTHFSLYAAGYHPVAFDDVASGTWYDHAVSFVAARGITTGTDGTHFSPDAALSRGQFLVMLLRAYGISADENPMDNFADAGNTYYTGYLAAAKKLGLSKGVGNGQFAPEQEITRQEMSSLLYNTLKSIGSLPEGSGGKAISDFSDNADIADWAKDAMKLLVETGTITGSADKLNPTACTTRAELSQVLYNLLIK